MGNYILTHINGNNKLFDSQYSPIQLTSQLKGLYKYNPMLALCLAISFFSLMGIPPLIGFFAKQLVLSAALSSGYYFLSLVAIITSVIGGVYYLGVVKTMFFDTSTTSKSPFSAGGHQKLYSDFYPCRPTSAFTVPISTITLITLFFVV